MDNILPKERGNVNNKQTE